MSDYLMSLFEVGSTGVQTEEKIELAKLSYYEKKLDYEVALFKDMYEKRDDMKEEVIQVVSDAQQVLNNLLLITTLIWGSCFEATAIGDFNNNNSRMVEHAVLLGTSIVICSFSMLEGVFLSMYLSEKEALFVSGDTFKEVTFSHKNLNAEGKSKTFKDQETNRNNLTLNASGNARSFKSNGDITVFESKYLDGLHYTLNLMKFVILVATVLLLWSFQLNLMKDDAWGHHKDYELLGWRHILPTIFTLVVLQRLFVRFPKSGTIKDGLDLTVSKYERQVKEIYCQKHTVSQLISIILGYCNQTVKTAGLTEADSLTLTSSFQDIDTGSRLTNAITSAFGSVINSLDQKSAATQQIVLTAINLREKAMVANVSLEYDFRSLVKNKKEAQFRVYYCDNAARPTIPVKIKTELKFL